ncbi:GyrI-like domain-containing protein [Mucilaginibacter ginsenosidivorans]|uniref:GyrI-like domain-containing protein n=1 Tax=Mucilaginibacter ginsenosidivorans TaxID=398053 RepID=A0A5B8UYS6_9SPHI|nr:GyrI-like domain-containing protein [Mucilaginibacter ginsenosidivorans]QEC63536.1 GyrI-like domain-containing protein [Mucilaginibacter ginsenosidivorans]
MIVEIVTKDFNLTLYGFSGTAVNKNYGDTGFKLMNKMWETIRTKNLKHKGMNVWVYGPNEEVFAGVEFDPAMQENTGLEVKQISLSKYAYYKHIGPYSGLAYAYAKMRAYLAENNLKAVSPGLEIYGHWSQDESKLETEILMCLG